MTPDRGTSLTTERRTSFQIHTQSHTNSSFNIEQHPTWTNTQPRTILEIELLFKLHLTQHAINSDTPDSTSLRITFMTAQRKSSFHHDPASHTPIIFNRIKPTRPQPQTNEQSTIQLVTATGNHHPNPLSDTTTITTNHATHRTNTRFITPPTTQHNQVHRMFLC